MLRDDLLLNPGASPQGGVWSRLQDKLFEEALVLFPEGTPDRWGKVAGHVPGKSLWEVREHYAALVHDVSVIEQGKIEIPPYAEWCTASAANQISFTGDGRTRDGDSERKKGVPWTEEEHRRFLIGLQKYGKGDWRSISRHSVLTRTPTQVASHAQKYYLRLNSTKKEKKRSSIHDITDPEGGSSAQTTDANWMDSQPVPPSTYVGGQQQQQQQHPQSGSSNSSAYSHFG